MKMQNIRIITKIITKNSLFTVLMLFFGMNLYAQFEVFDSNGYGRYDTTTRTGTHYNNANRVERRPFESISGPFNRFRSNDNRPGIGDGIGIGTGMGDGSSWWGGDRPDIHEGIGVASIKDDFWLIIFFTICYGFWIRLREKNKLIYCYYFNRLKMEIQYN